jgi:mandelate racemase
MWFMKIQSFRVRPVDVPLTLPLITSSGTIHTAPLVLLDIETDGGISGSSYVFAYHPRVLAPLAKLISNLEELLRGDTVAPAEISMKLSRSFRLVGPQGLTGMAAAAIDMAAWDACARAANLPLVRLLGGVPKPVPAYQSRGLGIIGPEKIGEEAARLIPGFRAIKARLGYADLETDLAVIREIRKALDPRVLLMTDYNQSLTAPEAIRRAQALEAESIYWMEEPVLADDFAGHAEVRAKTSILIQTGENWWGTRDMNKSIAAGASDFGMPDAVKIGGVTGWMRAAAIAHAHELPVSSHLYPEISAHLLAASPTAHWLEFVDFASPVLRRPAVPENGFLAAAETPGIGLEWDEAAVSRFTAQ